jgi:hypothetical protein
MEPERGNSMRLRRPPGASSPGKTASGSVRFGPNRGRCRCLIAVDSPEARATLVANARQSGIPSVSVDPPAEPIEMVPGSRLAWRDVARGLAVRTYERRPLREMLLDYICDASAGDEQSSLRSQSESQLQFVRLALTAELQGAVKEVADRSSGRTAVDLYGFAADLVNACFDGVPGALLEQWVSISRAAGVSDADFLYCPC